MLSRLLAPPPAAGDPQPPRWLESDPARLSQAWFTDPQQGAAPPVQRRRRKRPLTVEEAKDRVRQAERELAAATVREKQAAWRKLQPRGQVFRNPATEAIEAGNPILGPGAVGQLLGVTGDQIRTAAWDARLHPFRRPNGSRGYRLTDIQAYVAAHGKVPPPDVGNLPEWLDTQTVARLLCLSEQRLRELDARLQPERGADGSGPRRYSRAGILVEMRRRQLIA